MFQIPPEFTQHVTRLGLKTWVRRNIDKDAYYKRIQMLKEDFETLANGNEVDRKNIVLGLCGALDTEGILLTRASQKGADFDTPEKWLNICRAAAWIILQNYTRDIEEGVWP